MGLGLFFGGVIDQWWLAIVVGLYAVGGLATPRDRELEIELREQATHASLLDQLDALLARSKKRLPSEANEKLQAIRAILEALMPKLQGLADAGTVALGSLAIALFAHHLALMTVLVPILIALRLGLWRWAKGPRRAPFAAELLLFALCTAFGAFNDWNTVVRHGVYEYTVPVRFPELSTIPLWMLLFWGLVLRLMLTVASFGRLGATAARRNSVRMGVRLAPHAAIRLGLMLLLLSM